MNETQSPLNLEASEEKRKCEGEMGKVGFQENEYGETRNTISVIEKKKRERK